MKKYKFKPFVKRIIAYSKISSNGITIKLPTRNFCFVIAQRNDLQKMCKILRLAYMHYNEGTSQQRLLSSKHMIDDTGKNISASIDVCVVKQSRRFKRWKKIFITSQQNKENI